MPSLRSSLTALVLTGLLSSTAAFAAPITPTSTSFGTLVGATFGGSGIPNDAVAITTFGGVTLGLTATERYSSPAVGDNGAGTFSATPGSYGPSNPTYGLWNFNFYVSNASASNYTYQLLWDTNAGVGTDQSLLGGFTSASFAGTTVQNSWNLGMGFIGGSYNPAASGEYSFALILKDLSGAELARSAINVNVGTVAGVPDAASTGLLALFGLGTLVAASRLQRRKVSSR